MTADGVRKHDAFISYHSASSRRVAVFLQQQLERVARRSAGDSALRLFRDQTALTYSDLGEALQRELRGSHRFLLVLHRSTRDSRWVDEEVRYWLDHGGAPSRLILARADPDLDLSWDVERQAFCREDLLPASLRGLYRSEPLWIDISGRRLGRPHADHGELARLCATLLDEDPALVLQREVQEQRTRQRRLGGALVGVSMLLVLAVVASVLAVLNSREARRQTVEAEAQSQAAEALLVGDARPDQAVALAIGSAERSSSRSVRAALLSVVDRNRRLQRLLPVEDVLGSAPDDVAFDQSGSRLAAWRDDDGVTRLGVWAVDSGRVLLATNLVDALGTVTDLRLVGPDLAAFCTPAGPVVHRLGGDRSTEVLRLEGTSCLLRTFRGGLLLVGSGSGSSRAAVVDEASGRWRIYDDVAFAGTHPAASTALVRVVERPYEVVGAGLTSRPLAAPADVLSGDVVNLDRSGGVTLRSSDGRHWSARAAGGRGTYAPVPADALAVAPSARGGYVWVTGDGRLSVSGRSATLDLSDVRPIPEHRPDREVDLHVDASGRTAVVLFRSTLRGVSQAAVVQIDRPGTEAPRLLSTIKFLEDVLVRGQDDVLLLDWEDGAHLVNGADGKTERVSSATFFDASGERSVSMGTSLDLRLADDEVVPLDQGSDARAVAFTDDSTVLAVVRPAGPVALYSTSPEGQLPSPAVVATAPRSLTGAYGTVRYSGSDGTVLRREAGAVEVAYREAPGESSRVTSVSPEGARVVIATGRSGTSLGQVTQGLLVIAAGEEAVSVGQHCPSVAASSLAFLPGPQFRTDVRQAEAARLVDLSAASEDPTLSDCETGEDVPVPLGTTVLDYQMDAERGRIVWRQGLDEVQVTSWARGDSSSLRTTVLPGSAGAQASVTQDDAAAVVWAPDSGAATVLRLAGRTWSLASRVRTGLESVVAADLAGDLGLLVAVAEDGRMSVVDAASGRLVLRTPSTDERAGPVSSARVDVNADGELVVRLRHAALDNGSEPDDTLVRLPVSVDKLRGALCEKAPSVSGCR